MYTPNLTFELPKPILSQISLKLKSLRLPQDVETLIYQMFSMMLDICYSAVGTDELVSFEKINAYNILVINALDSIRIQRSNSTQYDLEANILFLNVRHLSHKEKQELQIEFAVQALVDFIVDNALVHDFKDIDFEEVLSPTAESVMQSADLNDMENVRVQMSNELATTLSSYLLTYNGDLDFREQTARWFFESKTSIISNTFTNMVDSFIEMRSGVIPKLSVNMYEEFSEIESASLDFDEILIPQSFANKFSIRHNPLELTTVPQEDLISVIKYKSSVNLMLLGLKDAHEILRMFSAVYELEFGVTNQIPTESFALFAILDEKENQVDFVMKNEDNFYRLNIHEAFWVLAL